METGAVYIINIIETVTTIAEPFVAYLFKAWDVVSIEYCKKYFHIFLS